MSEPLVRMARIAEAVVGRAGEQLGTVGLGSCVAVVLHDAHAGVGALAHVLLPSAAQARDSGNPARFADRVVPYLLERMCAQGALPHRMVAYLVGGASMFGGLLRERALNVGERNVEAARAALLAAGIPLLGEAVGGERGRSVRFDVARGTVAVSSAFRTQVVLGPEPGPGAVSSQGGTDAAVER